MDSMQDAPTDGRLSAFLGYNLKRALSVVQADLAQALAQFQLRATSFSALLIVVERPGINQTELAEALMIERSNLVQIIDSLAGRGLIERTPFPGDRRRHALMPTAEGEKLAEQARAVVSDHEDRVFGMLTPRERTDLHRLLTKVRSV